MAPSWSTTKINVTVLLKTTIVVIVCANTIVLRGKNEHLLTFYSTTTATTGQSFDQQSDGNLLHRLRRAWSINLKAVLLLL